MKKLHARTSLDNRLRRTSGFSLVEVLVALVVVSVGLLGLAKMESLALSSTTVAGARSIAAGQAASLAAMMHANEDFWQTPLVTAFPPTVTITSAVNPFAGLPACTSAAAPCTPTQMAQYDLQQWGVALGNLLPKFSANVSCAPPQPYTCLIQITWAENAVAMVSQQTNMLAAMNPSTYTMYVQP